MTEAVEIAAAGMTVYIVVSVLAGLLVGRAIRVGYFDNFRPAGGLTWRR